MNNVILIGRLTKDPEIRYSQSGTATCRFTLAVDRPTKQGEEKKSDFIGCVAFGATAENVSKYKIKGDPLAVRGRIQTGSYKNKDGQTVYTTDVIADNVEFIGGGNHAQSDARNRETAFEQIYEDIMF